MPERPHKGDLPLGNRFVLFLEGLLGRGLMLRDDIHEDATPGYQPNPTREGISYSWPHWSYLYSGATNCIQWELQCSRYLPL
jgi:hypothetical protein